MSEKKKLWGGRFRGDVDPIMHQFNQSLSFDQRMWKADIQGSKVYAHALSEKQVITKGECEMIRNGLDDVGREWQHGTFQIQSSDEDIHTANERRLTEIIGPTGGKLHTGRSRNDQVATDMRMYLKDVCQDVQGKLCDLLEIMTHLSEESIDCLLPGFTHLQPAQPVRFSHWVLSHAAALLRDSERLRDCFKRIDVLPLGSGALAGNSFGVDRQLLARDLGFACISINSLDAVCDRDFVAEFMFWASMTMLHLSQLSEDLIIYNTLKCVSIADAYSTGSSLMPQKKNPDALELLRGKTGRVVGRLTGFMMTLKGLPRSYNKDLQEDKEALFDCIDTIADCLLIACGVMSTIVAIPQACRSLLCMEMLATDLAEYLVHKGVPFRETHSVAGAAVRLAEDKNISISDLSLEDLQRLHHLFEADVVDIWDFEKSIERKDVIGGTSKRSVIEQINKINKWVQSIRRSKS